MRKLLVPIDFSEPSVWALEVAAQIIKKTGGKLYLLHVIDIPSYLEAHSKDFDSIPEGILALKMIRKQFKKIYEMPVLQGVDIEEVTGYNSIFSNIIETADEKDVDLIVMGSYGASGFQEFLIGSNTQKIVRTSTCPVLAIKDRVEKFHPENIVFASDFTRAMYPSFTKIKRIADIFKSNLHLLKVITPHNFENTNTSTLSINDFIHEFKLNDYSINIYNHESIMDGILEFSKYCKADLLAMGTGGRGYFSQLMHESLAERIVNRSEIPVLSARNK